MQDDSLQNVRSKKAGITCVVKRGNKMEKDSTTTVKRVALAVLTLIIIAYVISVAVKANFTQIKTEAANIMTVSDAIPTTGYFIRDEHIITYDGNGVISYVLNDGDKISVGEAVANVYDDAEAASDKRTIEKLEKQISNLKLLQDTEETVMLAPDAIDKNISTSLSKARLNAAAKNFAEADKNVNAALYSINQRQMVTHKTDGFSDKIAQLQQKVNELKQKHAKQSGERAVLSPKTGYFSSNLDGYENFYTSNDLDSLAVEDLTDSKITRKSSSGHVVGKTMEGVYWYIACVVSAEDAIGIKDSDALSVDIPLANNKNIAVELHTINQATRSSPAVVILKGSYMNEEMINLRKEDISIVKNTYEGIYVSRNAVHEQRVAETQTDQNGREKTVTKTVKGVYIMVGNELLFKQIVPLYTAHNYIICEQNPDESKLVTKEIGILKAYDDVVVEGANLYDGKIIDRTSS